MSNLTRFQDWRNKDSNSELEVKQEQKCNINDWEIEKWKSVPGIGEKLAIKIMEAAPHSSVEDLIKIKGVSKRIVENVSKILACTNFEVVNIE